MPYRSGYLTVQNQPALNRTVVTTVIERQTNRGVFGTTSYPLNRATRIEFSGAARRLQFSGDTMISTYAFDSEILLDQELVVQPSDRPLYLGEGSVAFVHDTSFFGATSPIYGARSRFEIGQTMGSLQYTTVLADVRRYFMPVKPITIAVRGMTYGRLGADAEYHRLPTLYVGYQDLVHGYGLGSFDASDCDQNGADGKCAVFNNLTGSGVFVANIEVRAPLAGLFTHEMDYGRIIPIEVAGFADTGVAWSMDSRPSFLGGSRNLVKSVGVAARINLFGILIFEVSASHPFDRALGKIQWQIGLRQGF
jgi:hypothetical protein